MAVGVPHPAEVTKAFWNQLMKKSLGLHSQLAPGNLQMTGNVTEGDSICGLLDWGEGNFCLGFF